MNNKSQKIYSYPFDKHGLVIVLGSYGFAYAGCLTFFTNDPDFCFLVATLFGLIAMSVLIIGEVSRRVNQKVVGRKREAEKVRRNIRNEFQRIHKINRAEGLVMEANHLDVISKSFSLDNNSILVDKVHFRYLEDSD